MGYVVFGFLFGVLVPYMARRFGKFMPATFAYAVIQLLRPNLHFVKNFLKKNPKHMKLASQYFWRSLLCGFVVAGLSYCALKSFGEANIKWYLFFIWSLVLLCEIDYRTYFLPDVITVPLLLFGFAYAVTAGVWVGPGGSAVGALAGYFIPVFASFLVVWKNKEAFGGGDIKLLAAVGAWFGMDKLLYAIILSSILFIIYAIVKRRKKGAFGPAIAISAIVIAFWFFRI